MKSSLQLLASLAVCRQTVFQMLHKFSLMNSPFKILTKRGVRVAVETRLFLECDHKRDQALGKAKLQKFITENFVSSRIQETSICQLIRLYAYRQSAQQKDQSVVQLAIKDGAHYCSCAHFLRMPSQSRAMRKKCATRRTRGLVLSPVRVGDSSYFLWKRCVVCQQMKNNFYLPCQFFENRRRMCMLLFLRMIDLTEHFYSQTKVNSKTSKVIASRCYAQGLGINKSLNRQGSVNQKENSSKSSA